MTGTDPAPDISGPRRTKSRLTTILPGKLTTMFGTENILLNDLSLTGAKLGLSPKRGIEERLRKGLDAVLEWNGHETFGQLVWVTKDAVGIHFDECIGTKALLETRALQDKMTADGGLKSHEKEQSKCAAQGWASGGVRI